MLTSGLVLHAEEKKEHQKKPKPAQYNLSYLKFGVGAVENEDLWLIPPLVGIGKRVVQDESGVDLSASISYAFNKNDVILYTLPKAMYLRYADPEAPHTYFFGLGASWGGVHNIKTKRHFHGIFGNLAMGLEFNRKSRFPSFLQCDLAIPAIAAIKYGARPSPSVELSYGIGY